MSTASLCSLLTCAASPASHTCGLSGVRGPGFLSGGQVPKSLAPLPSTCNHSQALGTGVRGPPTPFPEPHHKDIL